MAPVKPSTSGTDTCHIGIKSDEVSPHETQLHTDIITLSDSSFGPHSDLKTVLTVYKVNLSGEIKNCASSAVCVQKLSKNIPGDSVTVSLSSCLDVKPQVKKLSIKADLLIL